MSVTIEQMEEKAAKMADLRLEEEQAARAKKEVSSRLEQCEKEMLELLNNAGLDSYRSKRGLVGLSYRSSVKTPKTPEQRAEFFEYLKKQGVYESMVTVNSQTLNAFYKQELEAAQARGEADFNIPGLDEASLEQILSFRKA